MERELVERARQSLRAVDVGRPFGWNPRHFLRAHEGDHTAVAGVQEDVFDLATLAWLEDVAARNRPAELGGVEFDGAIAIESRTPQMVDAGAIHSHASSGRV